MPNNPPSSPPQSHHLPPSLPNSPIAKRPKTMTSAPPPPTDHTSTTNPPAPPLPLPQSPPLLVKKLSPAATPPTRGSAFAAGYDIYSARATRIPARGKGMVETDLAIAVPEGTCEFFPSFLLLFALTPSPPFRFSPFSFVSLFFLPCHFPIGLGIPPGLLGIVLKNFEQCFFMSFLLYRKSLKYHGKYSVTHLTPPKTEITN